MSTATDTENQITNEINSKKTLTINFDEVKYLSALSLMSSSAMVFNMLSHMVYTQSFKKSIQDLMMSTSSPASLMQRSSFTGR